MYKTNQLFGKFISFPIVIIKSDNNKQIYSWIWSH